MNVAVVLQGAATLLWMLVIGLIILTVVRASRGQKVRAASTAILGLAVGAVLLTTVSAGLVFIEPNERGVVISAVAPKGYREQALTPGLRWIIPFLERVVRYPISFQTYTMSIAPIEGQRQGDDSITARTADGQEVLVDASVIYALDPQKVVMVHIEWQDRYADDLVRPLSRGVIRDAISQYSVASVYSLARDQVVKDISNDMRTKLEENGLLLVDFVLRNITFSPEYAASVEQKQIAEQKAQQAKFVVEQRKQEAEQARQVAQGLADSAVIAAKGAADARLIQAQAEAEALELLGQSLSKYNDLLTYTYINKIAPGVQVMLVPNDNPYILPLPEMGPPAPTAGEGEGFLPALPAVPTPEPTPLPVTP